MRSIVTLTTDFGTTDAYVAVMKGVILNIAPETTIVDISHEIPPQDVVAGHFLLANAYRYFPPGTIHIGVVDPGVGTSRRPIALAADDALFVGPDNGLFSFLWAGRPSAAVRAVHLTNRAYWLPDVSATFHGRDIFAPVAAHLARGVSLHEMGSPLRLSALTSLPLARPRRRGTTLAASVVHVDRFGNLLTNIIASSLRDPHRLVVEVAGQRIMGLSHAYGDAVRGSLLALIGSAGYLEIAVNQGSAARRLGVGVGARLHVFDGISTA